MNKIKRWFINNESSTVYLFGERIWILRTSNEKHKYEWRSILIHGWSKRKYLIWNLDKGQFRTQDYMKNN